MNYSVLWNPRRLYRAIKRRVVQRRTFNEAISKGERRFGNDPNFRPDLVPDYFVPRLVDCPDDVLILKRIIAAYKKAKIAQKSSGEAFNVSNEWLPIYELQRMYQNFFRDPCSTGLVGLPINIPNLFSGGAIKQKFREYILCDVLHRYDLWKTRTGNKYPAAAL